MRLWKDARLSLSITRLGLQYVAAMLLVGAFAVNSSNNLLYIIVSLMIGLFLVSGWVSRASLQGLECQKLEEGHLFARARGNVRIHLKDHSPARVRGLEIHLQVEEGRTEPAFFPGGYRGEGEPVILMHAWFPKRGWARVRSVEFKTSHPFGFLEKAWRTPLDHSILVIPHPINPQGLSLPDEVGFEEHLGDPSPGEGTPMGTRPMREGDNPHHVHWKRTAARGGDPWVRVMEEEVPLGLHLHLDLLEWSSGPLFERELERLSGEILQARLQKRPVSLDLRRMDGSRLFKGHRECWRVLAQSEAEG